MSARSTSTMTETPTAAVEGQLPAEPGGGPKPLTEEQREAIDRMIQKLSSEGFVAEDPEGYVEAGPEDVLIGADHEDTFFVETGTYDAKGQPKGLWITIYEPRDPSLAGDYLASLENPDAYDDLCRMLVRKPRWLVEDKPLPVPDQPDMYVNATPGQPPVSDPDYAKKVPALQFARSIIQVNVRHKIIRACGVGGPFFLDAQRDAQRRMLVALKRSMSSQPNTESGHQSDSTPNTPNGTPAPQEPDKPSSQTSSPPTSTSKPEKDDASKASPSSSPPQSESETSLQEETPPQAQVATSTQTQRPSEQPSKETGSEGTSSPPRPVHRPIGRPSSARARA